MDVVTVYSQDVADVDDINRLSDFPRSYLELMVEAITNGKRDILFGTHTPTIFLMAAPNVTIRIPAQYIAVEGRIQFVAQTDHTIGHPAPGVAYDFGLYLTVRLDDQTEVRQNVNLVTFVQTPTNRVTHKLMTTEVLDTNVVSPGVLPVPAVGVGVPAPGQERLGYILLASFTWDGVAGTFTITQNTTPVVTLGSTGLPSHGNTHATSDPIPYPTNVYRGAMPPASMDYLKESISVLRKPAGSPMLLTPDGQNGPAGVTNYTYPYASGTARGYLLDVDVGASITKSGSKLHQTFGTPTGGTAGVANASARADHNHFVFPFGNIPKYYTHLGVSLTGPWNIAMADVTMTPVSIVIDATRPNQLAVLQVDMSTVAGGAAVYGDGILTLEINGGVSDKRYAAVRKQRTTESLTSTTTLIRLDATGSVTVLVINGGNNSGGTKYRIGCLGFFGQG